ncbi:MAG: ADP-ribosylglycohydrolase family protein [Clostridia bacterium]|nr:ADP-ribosylglycohydrolase family protein [Clostridia bacterium]MBQ9911046.1 ADP-ribosylglycohydrolase family protein [Lachnospiraceae bacterium]
MYGKILGGLLGGAIGDAMGAATETRSTDQIVERFGGPVTEFLTPHEGVFVSDWGTMTFSGVGMVTPERIPLLFSDGGFRDVQFLKE